MNPVRMKVTEVDFQGKVTVLKSVDGNSSAATCHLMWEYDFDRSAQGDTVGALYEVVWKRVYE